MLLLGPWALNKVVPPPGSKQQHGVLSGTDGPRRQDSSAAANASSVVVPLARIHWSITVVAGSLASYSGSSSTSTQISSLACTLGHSPRLGLLQRKSWQGWRWPRTQFTRFPTGSGTWGKATCRTKSTGMKHWCRRSKRESRATNKHRKHYATDGLRAARKRNLSMSTSRTL